MKSLTFHSFGFSYILFAFSFTLASPCAISPGIYGENFSHLSPAPAPLYTIVVFRIFIALLAAPPPAALAAISISSIRTTPLQRYVVRRTRKLCHFLAAQRPLLKNNSRKLFHSPSRRFRSSVCSRPRVFIRLLRRRDALVCSASKPTLARSTFITVYLTC